MQPFRNILFAADFSENSREAFRAACSVAIENKTRIFVLHVDEPNWVPEEPVYFGQQAIQYRADAPDKAHHRSDQAENARGLYPGPSHRRRIPDEGGRRRRRRSCEWPRKSIAT